MSKKEYQVLVTLATAAKGPNQRKNFPTVFGGGEFIKSVSNNSCSGENTDGNYTSTNVSDIRHSFIVMEKLGKSL